MTSEQFEKILPDCLKDFHDQKDVFKAIHQLYNGGETPIPGPNSWVDNHIFVMDYFLWFMARHGYRLQRFKSRHFEQTDLQETIEGFAKQRADSFADMLKNFKDSKP